MRSEPTSPLLRVTDATVAFGGVLAVDHVTFELNPGEIVGLAGPNGAGKSTLFGAVAGAVPIRDGRVELDGEPVTGSGPDVMARRGVARTFQKVRLFGSMSAFENVLVAATVGERSAAAAHRTTLEALRSSGYTGDPSVQVSALPLADRKRIEIARAIATRPRLLLLDEMLNGLTRQETDELVDLVRSLPGRGITVMLVEHVLHVVRSLCSRLIVLHHGRRIAEGSPGDVLSRDEVVEAWLGRAQAEES